MTDSAANIPRWDRTSEAKAAGSLSQLESVTWRTLLIAGLLCLWEGFPFRIVGFDPLLGYQLYAVIIVIGVANYIRKSVFQHTRMHFWPLCALGLFAWCWVVSINYSVFTVPQPLTHWILASYTVTPILTILLLAGINATLRDAQRAIFWTGVVASVLVAAESRLNTGFLSAYLRGSAFGESKIVFFKLISSFAMMIALVETVHARSHIRMLLNGLATVVTGYNCIILAESRLVGLGVVLASSVTWLLVLRGTRKLVVAALALGTVVPALWIVVSRYMTGFSSIDQYLATDVSANWRVTTARHFANYFYGQTSGMGFGFMSGNANYNNVIAFSASYASQLYGVSNYVVTLDDIGLVSALYQYGYVGLLMILVMSILCTVRLALAYRYGPQYASISAMGILMGALMISPVSMNYFTLFYTSHLGGLLWFMGWKVARLQNITSAVRTSRRRDHTFRTVQLGKHMASSA